MDVTSLPILPKDHSHFIDYIAAHPGTLMMELLEPYLHYEDELRQIFARNLDPSHAADEGNIISIFNGQEHHVTIRERNLEAESKSEKQAYIMPLSSTQRKENGEQAIVPSLDRFKFNLSAFSEGSLEDLDFSRVVVAGGAVAACMIPMGGALNSKAEIREHYHDFRAPATDVNLYLYDLPDEEAVAKIKQIDKAVRGVCSSEATTIRTRNAIVIARQHPLSHVTFHLRIYLSITEILPTFDIDCSCVAFDGKQVWASPRMIAAAMTQRNTLDPRRSSPFLERRLKQYRNAIVGFEAYLPGLDRSRIDPRVYEQDLSAADGLARMLIMEPWQRLSDRAAREERQQREKSQGRSTRDNSFLKTRRDRDDFKNRWAFDLADWADADCESIFHTFRIPYGPRISASDIEEIIGQEDLSKTIWRFLRDQTADTLE